MKKTILISTLLLFISSECLCQFIYKIKTDSLLVTNDSCNAELNLENSTRAINGFLYNKGNGRTEFRKGLLKVDDSVYVIGADTLRLSLPGGNYIRNQASLQASSNFNISTNGIIGGRLGVNKTPAYRADILDDATGQTQEQRTLNVSNAGATISGTFNAQGIHVTSSAGGTTNANFGIYSEAIGSGTKNIGVYSYTSNGNTSESFAGHFVNNGGHNVIKVQQDNSSAIAGIGFAGGTGSWGVGKLGTDGNFVFNNSIFFSGNSVLQLSTAGKVRIGGGTVDATNALQVDGTSLFTADTKVNGLTIGRGSGNMSLNTAAGFNALNANTTGNYNTAMGYSALASNTTGTINTAIGYASLLSHTTGNYNTGVGANTLSATTSGTSNTAIGYTALQSNTTGGLNTAVGHNALATSTTANFNTAVGRSALSANTADANTAVGYNALGTNTTGVGNVALGASALSLNTSSNSNTAIGFNVLMNNTGTINTGVGARALTSNTTGSNNTAMGANAMLLNTTGGNNAAFGYRSMESNQTGGNNTAYGYNSLPTNTTGSNNTALGRNALAANVTSDGNTAVGYIALGLSTGSSNTAMGFNSTSSLTTGGGNIAYGASSLYHLTSGNNNIGIGGGSGWTLTGGDNNIFIGPTTQPNISTTGSNQLNVGNWIFGDNGKIGIGVAAPAAKLQVAAGTATANTAPLKFTSGTNLTTPENGAVEYDGTNYFVTSGSTRYILSKTLSATATLNFASTAAQNSTDLTITVTGAADGDAVSLGIPNAAINANSSYNAWVSASNTVTVRFNNYSSAAVDPASASFRVSVMKY